MTHKPAYTLRPRETATADLGIIVAQCTALVFLGYFTIGLEAALVPTFVHQSLGLSTTLAGIALGSQALATLASRASAGRITDYFGARLTIAWGFGLMLFSGSLFVVAAAQSERVTLSFAVLLLSRLLLGWGISWVSAAGAVWGIGRAGADKASRVLVWSGVAANTSLALGAPVGLWLARHLSAHAVGFAVTSVSVVGMLFAFLLAEVARVEAEPLHVLAVLRKVAPYGSILAFSAVGYGTFAAFVTLYFQQQGWHGASYPLALYGASFVSVRILLGRWVDHYSVFQVGLASIAVELGALALLATAPSAGVALVASCLMGAGFSLLFPALCVSALGSVGPRDRASAISVFTAFLEFSLAVAAPLIGLVIARRGYGAGIWSAFIVVLAGFGGLLVLRGNGRTPRR